MGNGNFKKLTITKDMATTKSRQNESNCQLSVQERQSEQIIVQALCNLD